MVSPIAYDVDTLRARQNGHHFADNIFKCILLNENVWISIKISLKFVPKGLINNIPALVQIMNQWWLDYWHIYTSLGLNELICCIKDPNCVSPVAAGASVPNSTSKHRYVHFKMFFLICYPWSQILFDAIIEIIMRYHKVLTSDSKGWDTILIGLCKKNNSSWLLIFCTNWLIKFTWKPSNHNDCFSLLWLVGVWILVCDEGVV